MNIRDFATQYCSDIVTDAEKRSKMFDLSGFSYDEVITEEDGTEVRVVNTANYQIPITDILGLDRAEFARVWPYTECLEAYDTYPLLRGRALLDGACFAVSGERDGQHCR